MHTRADTALSSEQRKVEPATLAVNRKVAFAAPVVAGGSAVIVVAGPPTKMCTLETVCSSVRPPLAPVKPTSTFGGRVIGTSVSATTPPTLTVARPLAIWRSMRVRRYPVGEAASTSSSPGIAVLVAIQCGSVEPGALGPALTPTKFAPPDHRRSGSCRARTRRRRCRRSRGPRPQRRARSVSRARGRPGQTRVRRRLIRRRSTRRT